MAINRTPAGRPEGGQFSRHERPESDTELIEYEWGPRFVDPNPNPEPETVIGADGET